MYKRQLVQGHHNSPGQGGYKCIIAQPPQEVKQRKAVLIMKYFDNPQSIEQLKKQYHILAKKYHPDLGDDTEIMKQINAEFNKLFEQLKNVHQNAQGETYTTKIETAETPEQFKNIIEKLIHLDNINIEICGSWIWITGNTYNYKELLKGLKFRYSRSKQAWYYHSDTYFKKGKKNFTLDEIRSLYGSEIVTGQPQLKLSII